MRLETLISCMHQKDASIALTSNVRNNVVIVNQCDRDENTISDLADSRGVFHKTTFICTTERGLSRSRNMAIENATADICLIADDDEVFDDAAASHIIKAYKDHPEADIITFDVKGSHSTKQGLSHKAGRIGYLGALHISSVQITFRRQSIIEKGIRFDSEMGSGSGHGCGEEIKFLFDCLHKGLRIVHVPVTIATLTPGQESQWFKGWTPRFFVERGWSTSRYLGRPLATLYGIYYVVRKRKKYQQYISMSKAFTNLMKGVFHKTI